MFELRSMSVDDTRAIASAVAGLARPGDLIVLAGEMGVGKTAFAQGFATALGIVEPVTSPTYTIVHTYPAATTATTATTAIASTNTVTLHHADLYRLEHTSEVDDLALDELLDDAAIVLVEWGNVVELGDHLQIELRAVDDRCGPAAGGLAVFVTDGSTEVRDITITSSDRRWDIRRDRLVDALKQWAA
ncbi:MAG: tRNA (adenosine(37)-N6)-threonylcarbamoyltransferase complex ATPase subunit type 1 TsaE [Ilumatobacteraceae bacterium]